MEILIIGVVLVVIMVIVSTKIKNSAARAFEPEIIETDEFSLVKPTGLVNPIRDASEYAFEAYSRDYGEKNERNIWQAQVYLTVSEDLNFKQVCKKVKSESDKVLSEKYGTDTPENQKIQLLETEKSEGDSSFYIFHKIVESFGQKKVYDLQIKILQAFRDDYKKRVDEMLNSFRLK